MQLKQVLQGCIALATPEEKAYLQNAIDELDNWSGSGAQLRAAEDALGAALTYQCSPHAPAYVKVCLTAQHELVQELLACEGQDLETLCQRVCGELKSFTEDFASKSKYLESWCEEGILTEAKLQEYLQAKQAMLPLAGSHLHCKRVVEEALHRYNSELCEAAFECSLPPTTIADSTLVAGTSRLNCTKQAGGKEPSKPSKRPIDAAGEILQSRGASSLCTVICGEGAESVQGQYWGEVEGLHVF
ncbi:hypothetical protein WJX72_007326 [[Myrmecia] bisecta]|uniref:Uncharacterized protein n=1 Tax=[Myrmecia] bisecta TaxID=41462 RepID=A0AAW1PAZ1_9CHLO